MQRVFTAAQPLLPDIFDLHGRWRAGEPALVTDRGTLTWAALTDKARRVAHGLRAAGLVPGDRVAVLMSNGDAFAVTLMGAMMAGVCSVPLNLSVDDAALAAMVRDAGARAVVITADQAGRLDPTGHLIALVAEGAAAGFADFEDWLADQPLPAQRPPVSPETLLNIIYSSGTTGQPKGIAHTQQGRKDWAEDLALALRYHCGARTLITIGLYSNISWVAMLCTWICGGAIYVHKRFDAGAALDAVERDRLTHTAMVPLQFRGLLEAQADRPRDLGSIQAMMCCGSPLPVADKQALVDIFPCGVIELYGLTEGIITTLEPERVPDKIDTVGRPLPGCDLVILDEADQPLAPGQAGEIAFTGRITMPGYWNRPEATAETSWTGPDGRVWLRSGDIGQVDSDGFLTIVDRKKDMILSGGQNIYPADIEAVLITHPAVFSCAVIGVPDVKWGETPLALIEAPDAVDEAEVTAWLNARLGKQQRVRGVEIVAALPRNPNGKILKRELRKQYGGGDV